MGFPDATAPVARVAHWRGGTVRALRSKAALSALEAVLHGLMAAIARAPDPAADLNRLATKLCRRQHAINFLKLLVARPVMTRTEKSRVGKEMLGCVHNRGGDVLIK